MQSTDIPAKFINPFGFGAAGANIRAVPATSADPNAASVQLGFPPNTFLDVSAGGKPPDGRDVNGILNQLSAWARWQAVGGAVLFDSAIATAGGYPKGARVASTTNPALVWVSTIENNTNNPDVTGSSGWVAEGDVGHNYNVNNGHITIGPLILNFGHTVTTDSSGHVGVTFDMPFSTTVLAVGATNDCGNGFPSSWSGAGNATLSGMNVGSGVTGSAPGGAGLPAGAGTASFWWALGI